MKPNFMECRQSRYQDSLSGRGGDISLMSFHNWIYTLEHCSNFVTMTSSMIDLAAMQQRLEQQPFTRLLGAQLTAAGHGTCELRIPVRVDLNQQNGFVHGGVICYAADNALTIAGALAANRPVLTSELKINYIRPAIGEAVVARAQVVYAGKSQAVCRCDVFAVNGEQEKLCAVAQGTIALLPSERAA